MNFLFKKICIASDHAGFNLKEEIKDYLINKSVSIFDLGPYQNKSVDYPDYAKKVGMKDVFAHGMLIMAYLGRALTNIIPQSNLKNLNTKFCSITNIGDVLTCSGSVSNIHNRNSKVMIVFDIMVADETGNIKIIGTATIEK